LIIASKRYNAIQPTPAGKNMQSTLHLRNKAESPHNAHSRTASGLNAAGSGFQITSGPEYSLLTVWKNTGRLNPIEGLRITPTTAAVIVAKA